jgi:hypothetical protein
MVWYAIGNDLKHNNIATPKTATVQIFMMDIVAVSSSHFASRCVSYVYRQNQDQRAGCRRRQVPLRSACLS